MALPQGFLDEIRHRVPLHSLIGRGVRLAKSGRHWKGCCPFHNEKSPSFYVYEDHFHCFGCGAHGDAVSFVMQKGATFVEAVQQLASEAGLEMPRPDPRDEMPSRIRALYDLMLAARTRFCAALFAPEGRAALAYIRDRGIGDESIAKFSLGYADDRNGGIQSILTQGNWPPALLREAGLVRDSDEGRARDFFFRRLIFPITDRKGQVISFGGRILGDGQPKYLNGPETPLFSKRRSLYGIDTARAGVRQGAPLLAVEGYLDVISLHQAGLTGAVAPLGTALTAEQLEDMWRLSPQPILCFDGDAAGRRAARKAVETALPLLTPQRSLSVALLPDGEDPDTLVRRGGEAAMQAQLSKKQHLAEFLFDALHNDAIITTPEGKALFRQSMIEAAEKIGDKNLANEYRRDLLDRAFTAQRQSWNDQRTASQQNRHQSGFNQQSQRSGNNRKNPYRPAPIQIERPEILFDAAAGQRHRLLIVILFHHPALLPEIEEEWVRTKLPDRLETLREAMLAWSSRDGPLDTADLFNHLRDKGFASEVDELQAGVKASGGLPSCCRKDASPDEALSQWRNLFGLTRSLDAEVQEAERAFIADPTPETALRLSAVKAAQLELTSSAEGTDAE